MKHKIKIIVLDTNVYGWYLSYSIKGKREKSATYSYILISKLLENKEFSVLATEQIEKEIKKSKDPELKSLFYSLVVGIIKRKRKIMELTNRYFETSRKSKLYKVTMEDCEIIASITLAGIKFFVTENRESINNPLVKKVFDDVDHGFGLKTPKIIESKEAIHELFS